jgi:hypothetical protein
MVSCNQKRELARMSNEKTELLSVVKDLIKEQDDLEEKLPLDEPKFGRWPRRKSKRTRVQRSDDEQSTA